MSINNSYKAALFKKLHSKKKSQCIRDNLRKSLRSKITVNSFNFTEITQFEITKSEFIVTDIKLM